MPLPDDSPAGESVYDAVKEAPFRPYEDPDPVQPTSPPQPVTTPGPDGGTPGDDGDAAPSEPQAEPEPPPFDPRYREPFNGLLFLGRMEKTFTLWGHEFRVKTMTTEEMAEIALFMAKYDGTRSQNAVYQSAVCAATVLTVDGQQLPQSLSHHDSGLTFRIEWVMKNWAPAVRERVWDEVFALETKVREVLDAMGEASG